ncbi:hypothetical protein GCK72_012010 [Caenorhabditis remanei]|uniref:SCP domain-containing protein n=1 Tax=Caenorhabditis remanei TaxID=31234 RepID=A0A6A5GJV6_CAERE|nr:hypothetical protein GCK72_012010 [Caenorhabditis remanei]KAF1755560.1 hypothetical protein GCK72_012010 [Caenorhabditis remanei]
MKWLSISIILLILVQVSGPAKMNPFNFRKKMLDQFNGARRILASGDVSKLAEVLALIPHLKKLFKEDVFGPAADMYKMVWNRQLEQAAWEYMKEGGPDLKKFGGTLHHKDYIGFHWMGDIWKLVELAFSGVPIQAIKEKLQYWLELIEKVVILLWMGLSIPLTYPIEKGKELPYQTRMFTPGAACSKCETSCELIKNEEGVDEIGELCVPPTGFYAQQQEEMKALETSFSSSAPIILVIVLVILFVLRRQ